MEMFTALLSIIIVVIVTIFIIVVIFVVVIIITTHIPCQCFIRKLRDQVIVLRSKARKLKTTLENSLLLLSLIAPECQLVLFRSSCPLSLTPW